MNRAQFWIMRLAILLVVAFSAASAQLAVASRTYCGVYALYGAAQVHDRDVELRDLIEQRFISSRRGSSTTDLQAAAKFVGLDATPLFGLGRTTLVTAEHPLILHVSPRGFQGSYTHWVLFLGLKDGKAIVHDGPGGASEVAVDSLLARWDGVALAITEPQDQPAYTVRELAVFAIVVLIVSLLVYFLSALGQRWHSLRAHPAVSQVAMITAAAITFALASFFFLGGGTAEAIDARNGIDAALGQRTFVEVARQDLKNLIDHRDVTLIDSRYQRDFERGTIPSAINLPLDTGHGDFQRITAQLPRHKTVVVFCQSQGCHFSDYTAAMLIAEGFSDVRIYRDGYAAWREEA